MFIILTYIGTILTSPQNFTFVPGTTPSPIQLTCDVTPTVAWAVNNSLPVLLNRLDSVGLGLNGTNVVINNPMNNSQYFCSNGTNDGEPYYIFVAGKCVCMSSVFHLHTLACTCVCVCVNLYL